MNTSPMSDRDIELSMFLDMPVADGLDAVEEALLLYRSSRGETRTQVKRMLVAMRLMFSKLAPKCTSEGRWEELKRQIIEEIG